MTLNIKTTGGIRYAVIAYGTTSRRRSNVGEEIHVRKREAFTAAGLNEPTRFIGGRRILVPLTHSGFEVASKIKHPQTISSRLSGFVNSWRKVGLNTLQR